MKGEFFHRYRRLFAIPGFRTSVIAATAGKFQPAMYGLSLLTLASRHLDYSTAAVVVSGLSWGAVTTPLRGRLLDRVRYGVVLWPLLVLHVTCSVLLILGLRAGAGVPILFLLAVLASVFMPPVGTLTRVMWRRATTAEVRTSALALDAVLADFGFVVGPVLAVSIALTVSPEASVLTCAALLTIAVPLVLRGAGRQRPDVIVVGRHWSGPLRSSAVRWVFGVATFFFIGVHVMEVVLVSYGGSQKVTLTGGALLSVIAIASMVGGTVLGGLPEGAARRFMRPAMVMSGIAAFLLLLVGATFVHPVLVFAACVPVGLCLGPSFAAVYGAAGDNAPEGQETETQSWVAGAMMLGGGIGTAAGGWSIQHAGLSGALLIAPVGCAIAALCATRLPRAGG